METIEFNAMNHREAQRRAIIDKLTALWNITPNVPFTTVLNHMLGQPLIADLSDDWIEEYLTEAITENTEDSI